jgi:thiamine monophosphate kinase
METSRPPINGTDASIPEPASPSDVNSRYNVTIAGGDTRISYVRTGEVGFLWNYSKESFNGGKPTSLLFVLGSIGETFEVNGLMHFPKDIEATIERSHPNVAPNGRYSGLLRRTDEQWLMDDNSYSLWVSYISIASCSKLIRRWCAWCKFDRQM